MIRINPNLLKWSVSRVWNEFANPRKNPAPSELKVELNLLITLEEIAAESDLWKGMVYFGEMAQPMLPVKGLEIAKLAAHKVAENMMSNMLRTVPENGSELRFKQITTGYDEYHRGDGMAPEPVVVLYGLTEDGRVYQMANGSHWQAIEMKIAP